jgi:hypothetical protein
MSFVASGLVTGLYLVPALEAMATKDALTAIAVIHTYRFIGLAFLVPGVVSEELPREFARPAAYGDLIAAILAVLSTVMLHGDVVGALAVTWLFNIWGTGDLVNAMFQGTRRIAAEGRNAFHSDRHRSSASHHARPHLLAAGAGDALSKSISHLQRSGCKSGSSERRRSQATMARLHRW